MIIKRICFFIQLFSIVLLPRVTGAHNTTLSDSEKSGLARKVVKLLSSNTVILVKDEKRSANLARILAQFCSVQDLGHLLGIMKPKDETKSIDQLISRRCMILLPHAVKDEYDELAEVMYLLDSSLTIDDKRTELLRKSCTGHEARLAISRAAVLLGLEDNASAFEELSQNCTEVITFLHKTGHQTPERQH